MVKFKSKFLKCFCLLGVFNWGALMLAKQKMLIAARSIIVMALIVFAANVTAQQSMKTFHVGNSLTDQAYGMHDIAEAKGHISVWARFMIPGAPLEWLWNNPNSDFYKIASEPWDNLILQPYDRGIASDVQYGSNFMNEAFKSNPSCRTYIFAHWPKWEDDFNAVWTGSSSNSRSRAHFEGVCNGLRNNFPNKEVYIIPVGEVMYELGILAQNGLVPGITNIDQLYNDGVHLNSNGKYVEAVTHFATVFSEDPQGSIISGLYFWSGNYSVSADFAQVVWDVVWDVVTTYPYTGVGGTSTVPVTGISLSPTSISVDAGSTITLTPTISPSNATNKSVSWTSGNTAIATVSNGVVTGISEGLVNITATTNDGGFTSTSAITVNVAAMPPASGYRYLKFVITSCSNYKLIELSWLSGTSEYPATNLSSNASGGVLVTGDFTNGYRAFNGVTTDSDGLWVGADAPKEIILDLVSGAASPDGIRIHKMSWNSLTAFRCEGSTDGQNWVTLLEENAASGSWTDRIFDIEVGNTSVPVTGVSLTPETATLLVNQSINLQAVVSPSNASNQNISWASSNNNVATVSTTGEATAKAAGNATITVTTEDGSFTANAALTVNVNTKPIGVISATPVSGNAPLTVQFDGTGSYDNDLGDQVYGYEWDFGDGSPVEQSVAPSHTFSTPGTYNVSLVVVDYNLAQSDPVYTTITVNPVGEVVNLLSNGDFSSGTENWSLLNASNANFSIVNGQAFLDISSSGPEIWKPQMVQSGINIEQGKTYTLSFDAKGAAYRDIQVYLNTGPTAYTAFLTENVSLTSSMQTFTYTFTAASSDTDARLDFNCGGGSIVNVTIDNVSLTDGTNQQQLYSLQASAVNGSILISPKHTEYPEGTEVSVTAEANQGYVFTGWSGDLSGSLNPNSLVMDGNKSITANFEAITQTYSLNLSVNGTGTITADPDKMSYNAGEIVILTATPSTGNQFDGWSGDNNTSINPLTITMDANKGFTANFSAIPPPPPPAGAMTIGTNFWDIAWGNANPWANASTNAIDPARVNDPTYEPWNQTFINEISFYSVLRFMDFGRINNQNNAYRTVRTWNGQPERNWTDRVPKDRANQQHMAIDWMIDLCNRTNTDMWICLPELSEQDYWQGAAQLIKDNLNPGLKVYIEYSNEVWNGQFSAKWTALDAGRNLGLWYPGDPVTETWAEDRVAARYVTYVSVRIWETFENVFGSEMSSRVVKVLPGTAENDWWDGAVLDALGDASINPNNTMPDAFAIAPYIGNGLNGASSTIINEMNQKVNEIVGSVQEIRDVIDNVSNSSNSSWIGQYNSPVPGLPIVCYEGGQHLLNNANVFSANQQAYDVYTNYLDALSAFISGPFVHYTHSGTWNSGGAWGAKESIGQDPAQTPKFRALYDWATSVQDTVPDETYTLTVNAVNGSVSVSPIKTSYTAGENVTLTASPDAGYVFDGWTGAITSTLNPYEINMNGNKVLTANFSAIDVGGTTKYEAEDAQLTGVNVASSLAGYSGTGYIDAGSFDANGDKVTFTVNMSTAGNYPLIIRYGGFNGEKCQNVIVNGVTQYICFPASTDWADYDMGNVNLNAGANTIEIVKSYGWMAIDYIEVQSGTDSIIPPSESLSVNPLSLSFGYQGGSNNIAVTSNTAWTVTSNQAWITVSQLSGSGNGSITVSTTSNSNSTSRTGLITVSGAGIVLDINVYQDADGSIIIPVTGKSIGTNFWVVNWGDADPFINGWQNVTGDNPWKPEFLDEIGIYSTFRFMDWNRINDELTSHPGQTWAERVQKSDPIQNPVAYEWQIDLCNRKKAHMWVNIPAFADRNYLNNLATLIYNTLDPDLKVYVEWSNEVWLSRHDGQTVASQVGQQNGYSGFQAITAGWAIESIKMIEEFEAVFGANNNRLVTVVAGQVGNTGIIDQQLDIFENASHNPNGVMFDAYATAPYVGNVSYVTTVNDLYTHLSTRIAAYQSDRDKLNARGYSNVKLLAYEGGQHVANEYAIQINTDPAIYDFYIQYFNDMMQICDDVFCHYVHSGTLKNNGLGSWGAKEYMGQPIADAHKYRALNDYIIGAKGAKIDNQQPIAAEDSELNLLVYPNPVQSNSSFIIELKDFEGENIAISLTNINGSVVYQTHTNDKLVELPARFSKGLYIVRVLYNNGSIIGKLMVN